MTENIPHVAKFTPTQIEYLTWLATPEDQRGDILTKQQFADKIGVNRSTLYEWENINGFNEERLRRIIAHFAPQTVMVIKALAKKVEEGNVKAMDIWLERIEQIAAHMKIDLNNENEAEQESLRILREISGKMLASKSQDPQQ